MKLVVLLVLIAVSIIGINCEMYNILSLESCLYKGYMTAKFVDYLEQRAYMIAQNYHKQCNIPKRESQKISMVEFFDMIAGSESGAILASTLVIKNDNENSSSIQANKFFADKVVDFYENQMNNIYKDNELSTKYYFLIICVTMLIFGAISYFLTRRVFNIKNFETHFKETQSIIEQLNSEAEGAEINLQGLKNQIDSLLKNKKVRSRFSDIVLKAKSIRISQDKNNMQKLKEYFQIQRKLLSISNKYNQNLCVKNFVLFLLILISGIISWKLTDLMSYLFFSQIPISKLQDSLVGDQFIPQNYNVSNLAKKDLDLMLVSWDLNNRSPRFFTKNSMQFNSKDQDYNMTLSQMMMASAANPKYFTPFQQNNNYYISGDNVAQSPALHAFLYATQALNKNPSNVRVVSVGCVNSIPDKINNNTGLLDWATRLVDLQAPVKRHTMDYMLYNILSAKNQTNTFFEFEIQITSDEDNNLYLNQKDRLANIKEMAASMIYQNDLKTDRLLQQLLVEKFGCSQKL